MRVCVVVPTIGRGTLSRTLASISPQLRGGDLCIVIADSTEGFETARAASVFDSFDDGSNWIFDRHPCHCWGHGIRNYAMNELCEGDLMVSIDDDDVLTPDALSIIRGADPSVPTIFRMEITPGTWLWRHPTIEVGNVGTPMIVSPVGCQSRWGKRYAGDADFAFALEEEYGSVSWSRDVVAVIRP